MNRKNFLTVLAGTFGAFCVGIKAAKAKGLSCAPSPAADPVLMEQNREFYSEFQSIEVCGVPIYCDPYCPNDRVYVLGIRSESCSAAEPYCLHDIEVFDLPAAMQHVIGDKVRRGQAAKLVITPNKRWRQLAADVVERNQSHRIKLCQS